MSLADTYDRIKPSVVAFTAKYSVFTDEQIQNQQMTAFPPIIGTGFVFDKDGIIATNDHIAEELVASRQHPLFCNGECLYFATLFRNTDMSLIQVPLEIIKVYQPKSYPLMMNYGPEKPDIAFVLVKAKELPALKLDTSILREGVGIATAGYPMGTNALTAPGYLHQIGPTLQKGIISAILPFPQPRPHAYSLNVMVQGGASGSPVFIPKSGKIIGIINSILYDIGTNAIENNIIRRPTNISYATPSYNILEFFEEIKASGELKIPTDSQTLEELFSSNEHEINLPGEIPGTVTRFDVEKPNEDAEK